MLHTTSNNLDGYRIVEYKKIVFGEVVSGVNFLKDFTAGLRDFFGGRSKHYEDELQQAREEAISEMLERASRIGANAVIAIDVDYEVLGQSMLMVTTSGTAVVVEKI